MDFHGMKRKELQSLCKKYNIPANLSNLNMADKLTELIKEMGKEKEKPLIRGHPSLNRRDKTECDSFENKKPKKVRFSPEYELFEFTRSRDLKGRGRRKLVSRDNSKKAVAESLNNEKKRGRKLAKIDDVKYIVDSIDAEIENECVNKVDSLCRVLRPRRQTLVDLLVNNVKREENRVVISRCLRNRKIDRGVKENVKEKEEASENTKTVILEPEIGLRRSKRNAIKVKDEGANKFDNGGRRCSRNKQNDLALEASILTADSATENVKACEKRVENQDRGLRSRRKTLVDAPVDENKRGRQGVDNDAVLANVECQESRVVLRRPLRNKERVNEAAKENLKEKEEVLENKEIVEENMNLEPTIVTRRSRRNADKFEDEGARKYAVEGRHELENRIDIQLRKSNRCKKATDSHEKMGNNEPLAENKDEYQLSTIMETGTIPEVPKDDATIAHHNRITRSSRCRTVVSQSTITHRIWDEETIEHGRLQEPIREPCLVEEGPIREVNTRRSRRIASKKEAAAMMDGKDNVPRKSGGRKRKGVCISEDNIIKPDDDCNKRPLSNGNHKATHMPVNSKVGRKRKQPSIVEKPNLVKASHEDMSAVAESFPVDAQLSTPQVEEITTDAAMSCYDIAMNSTNDAGQTSGGDVYGEKQNALVEVNAGSIDTKEVNGLELENRENNLTSKNVVLQIENPEPELEISVSKFMEVVNKFHVPVEVKVDNSFDDKDESAAAGLVGQTEDFGCFNMLGGGEEMSYLNITGNSGSSRVIPSTNVLSLINESASLTKLDVIEAELDTSAKKTIYQSLNGVDYFIQCEVDNVQANLDMVGHEAVNEITSSSNGCHSDVDRLAASNQRFEEGKQDTALRPTEDSVCDPCSETGNRTSIQESKYAEDPLLSTEPNAYTSFETDTFSDIHCSDHIASTAMCGLSTEINVNASSSCSMEASVFTPNSTRDSLGNAGLESHNETKPESLHSRNELYAENSLFTIQKDALVESSSNSDRNHDIIVAELEDHLSRETECVVPKKIDGAEILQPISSEQGFTAIDADRSCPFTSPLKGIDTGTLVGELKGMFATHVEATNSKPEKEALSIGTKTSGFETSLRTNVSKGNKGTHGQVNGSSENDENEPGLLVDLFATPVGITNSIQKKEAWSIGGKAAGDTLSLTKTTSKGANGSSNKERHEDIARSIYSACNKVEFESNIGLVKESLDPEKVDASVTSVSEDNRGEEIHVASKEGWSKQSNADRTETLLPIIVALPALVAREEEFRSPSASHDDATSIHQDEAMSIGRKARGEVKPAYSSKRKEDYVILSQGNKIPIDEVHEPGLLENIFGTPVNAVNTTHKKEDRRTASQAAGSSTLFLGTAASNGANDISRQADESSCKDRNETSGVAMILQKGIDVGGTGEESWLKQSTAIRKETLQPIIVTLQVVELNNSFAAYVCDANTIQENEASGSGNSTVQSASVHITTSKGDCGILGQVNHSYEELRDDLSVNDEKGTNSQINESAENDENEPGLFVDLLATPIGITNSTQKKEAWSIGGKAAGDALSLTKTASKEANVNSNEDNNDDVAKSLYRACHKVAFESNIGLVTESLEPEKVDPSVDSLSEDNRGEEIDATSEEGWSKKINADRTETLLPINIALPALAATEEEFTSPFATHVGDTNSIQDDEAMSIGSKQRRAVTLAHRTNRKEGYVILSQNISPIDEVHEPGLLESRFATPVGAGNTTEKEDRSTGSQATAGSTLSLGTAASRGENDTFSQADENSCKDRNETLDAANKMESESHFGLAIVGMNSKKIDAFLDKDTRGQGIDVNGSGEESGLKQSIANRKETLQPIIVTSQEELNSSFEALVCDANTIQENGASGCINNEADTTSVHRTTSKGDSGIFGKVNHSDEELPDDLSVTPVGVVNIKDKERNLERKVAVHKMSLDKTASKGGRGISSQAYESSGRDRNDQNFSHLFGTPINSTSCDTPNVDAGSSIPEKEAMSIGSKTAGSATRSQANASPEDDENMPGLLVNLFATPFAIQNTIPIETWSAGGNTSGETISLNKTTRIGVDGSSNKDKNANCENHEQSPAEIVDVPISVDTACNNMEFDSIFELLMESMDSEEIDVSVMKDTRGKDIDAAREESLSKQSNTSQTETHRLIIGINEAGEKMSLDEIANKVEHASSSRADLSFSKDGNEIEDISMSTGIANRTETLLPVIVALPASAAIREGLKSPFMTHSRDAHTVQENEGLIIGSRTAEKPTPIQSTVNKGDYAILSQVNQRNEDDANEQDQLRMLSPTPVKSAIHSMANETVERNEIGETQSTPEESKETQNIFQNADNTDADYGAESCLAQDKAELSSSSLAVSVLSVSGYDEIFKESDAKSTIWLDTDDLTHVNRRTDEENDATLFELQARSNLKAVKVDEIIDKHKIENEDGKVEEMQLVETAWESKDTVASLAYADVAIGGSKNFCPTAENAARTILIHGTPKKALVRGDMKENAPDSKRDNTVNLTTARPAKRRALQDLQ